MTVVPVEGGGVLLVRGRQETVGLGLPSAFVEFGERWQDTAAGEVAEETGIRLDPGSVRELRVRTGADGTLLVFASAPPVSPAVLRAFKPSAEVSEVVVAGAPRREVVVPLDNELLADWFSDTVPPRRVARLVPEPGSPTRSAWRRHDPQLGVRAHGRAPTKFRQSRHAPRCTCPSSRARVFA